MRRSQQDDISNNLTDISYNFVITEFGIFECRGWDRRPKLVEMLEQSRAEDDNIFAGDDFLYIQMILATMSGDPYLSLIEVRQRLIQEGIVLGKVSEEYKRKPVIPA